MDLRIVYTDGQNNLKVIVPAPAARLVGESDNDFATRTANATVPQGFSFQILHKDNLPQTRLDREAWVQSGSFVVTDGVKSSQVAAQKETTNIANAKTYYELATKEGKILRALVATLLDEINTLRGRVIAVDTFNFDPTNLVDGAGLTQNAPMPDALPGDFVRVSAPYSLQGITCTAYVNASGQISLRLQNESGGNVNLGNGTWTAEVTRPIQMNPRTMQQAKTAIENKLDASI